MMKNALFCLLLTPLSDAFSPVNGKVGAFLSQRTTIMPEVGSSAVLSPMNRDVNQRQSSTQLYGLFGLGGPEIAIIGIAAAFLLGPEKLAEFGKDAGKIAGELKEVPKEFQKGLEEGETNAKAMQAKNAETQEESK